MSNCPIEYIPDKNNFCIPNETVSTTYIYEEEEELDEESEQDKEDNLENETDSIIEDNNNNKEREIEDLKQYLNEVSCNESFLFEKTYNNKCIKDCELESLLNKSCIINNQAEKSKNKIFDVILEKIDDLFINNYNISKIKNGKDDIFQYENMTVTLTTTKNQKDNEKNGNVSSIDLGECETILKEAYNISNNETLYMKKIEVYQEGMLIPKIEYDVYSKLNGTNLMKLNLSYCNNVTIDISVPIPIQINKNNIDQYNSSSGYYNDICYTATSDSGTDITLKDRKTEFKDNNKTLCQDDCFFSDFDYNINKAKCSCNAKEASSKFEDIKIDGEKIYENFIDIKNIANINILVCYKVLFSIKGLIKNYGSYCIIVILIIHLIIIMIYYLKKLYNRIHNIINNISFRFYKFLPIKKGKNKEILKAKTKQLKKEKKKKSNKKNKKKSKIK